MSNVADLKYFDYGTEPEGRNDGGASPRCRDGSSSAVRTTCPTWGTSSRCGTWPSAARFEPRDAPVAAQPGRHKLILKKSEFDTYKKTDYLIHIHPHLCLFEDVKFVSGEAFGKDSGSRQRRGARTTSIPARHRRRIPTRRRPRRPPSRTAASRSRRARTRRIFKDPKKLKDADPTKPIDEWLKRAVFSRLRKPRTLYDKKRQFIIRLPTRPGRTRRPGTFPRSSGAEWTTKSARDRRQKQVLQVPALQQRPTATCSVPRARSTAAKLCGGRSRRRAGPPGSRCRLRRRTRAAAVAGRHVLAGDVRGHADAARAGLHAAPVQAVRGLAGQGRRRAHGQDLRFIVSPALRRRSPARAMPTSTLPISWPPGRCTRRP